MRILGFGCHFLCEFATHLIGLGIQAQALHTNKAPHPISTGPFEKEVSLSRADVIYCLAHWPYFFVGPRACLESWVFGGGVGTSKCMSRGRAGIQSTSALVRTQRTGEKASEWQPKSIFNKTPAGATQFRDPTLVFWMPGIGVFLFQDPSSGTSSLSRPYRLIFEGESIKFYGVLWLSRVSCSFPRVWQANPPKTERTCLDERTRLCSQELRFTSQPAWLPVW